VGPPVSSNNKTARHNIAEILLKVALNTIKPNQANPYVSYSYICNKNRVLKTESEQHRLHIGNCKSNYHTITAAKDPYLYIELVYFIPPGSFKTTFFLQIKDKLISRARLLKVALNTIKPNQANPYVSYSYICNKNRVLKTESEHMCSRSLSSSCYMKVNIVL
jgi:hypothetical protein